MDVFFFCSAAAMRIFQIAMRMKKMMINRWILRQTIFQIVSKSPGSIQINRDLYVACCPRRTSLFTTFGSFLDWMHINKGQIILPNVDALEIE